MLPCYQSLQRSVGDAREERFGRRYLRSGLLCDFIRQSVIRSLSHFCTPSQSTPSNACPSSGPDIALAPSVIFLHDSTATLLVIILSDPIRRLLYLSENVPLVPR